jgi:hypothetical protein
MQGALPMAHSVAVQGAGSAPVISALLVAESLLLGPFRSALDDLLTVFF